MEPETEEQRRLLEQLVAEPERAAPPPGAPPAAAAPERPEGSQALELRDFTCPDGGPPRVFSPLLDAPRRGARTDLPLLMYLPGLDGTGLLLGEKFSELSELFDIECLANPAATRTSHDGVLAIVAERLRVAREESRRPVYVLGESFGGVLAMGMALDYPELVDRVILVNPATSYDRSVWPNVAPNLLAELPDELYSALPYVLAPILGDPIALARRRARDKVPEGAAPWDEAAALAAELPGLLAELPERLPQLSLLETIIPRDALRHRCLAGADGCKSVNPRLGEVKPPVLALIGAQDALIPSAEEGERLAAGIPRCTLQVYPQGTHALVQELPAGELTAVLSRTGFYRGLTREVHTVSAPPPPAPRPAFPRPPSSALAQARYGFLEQQRRAVSPVYLSTTDAGVVVDGLGALPRPEPGRPLLFVGNHQTFATDLGLLIEGPLVERNVLLRGLAHPFVFQTGRRRGGQGGGEGGAGPRGPFGESFGGGGAGPGGQGFFEQFGALPVSGKNLYRLLAAGEAALLFPGGVREAYKRRGEKYKLFWPERPEFVRMAVRHGATIVPFAAVGAEDGVEILADADDLQGAPVVGDWVRERAAGITAARRDDPREQEQAGFQESFIQPVAIPLPPERYYFRFGRPIETASRRDALKDEEAAAALYGEVRDDVEAGIEYLLRKREEDPYKDLAMRLLYEATWGGRRAPTFVP